MFFLLILRYCYSTIIDTIIQFRLDPAAWKDKQQFPSGAVNVVI
jgi:hypothetical protein